jgi:hypothetical protein
MYSLDENPPRLRELERFAIRYLRQCYGVPVISPRLGMQFKDGVPVNDATIPNHLADLSIKIRPPSLPMRFTELVQLPTGETREFLSIGPFSDVPAGLKDAFGCELLDIHDRTVTFTATPTDDHIHTCHVSGMDWYLYKIDQIDDSPQFVLVPRSKSEKPAFIAAVKARLHRDWIWASRRDGDEPKLEFEFSGPLTVIDVKVQDAVLEKYILPTGRRHQVWLVGGQTARAWFVERYLRAVCGYRGPTSFLREGGSFRLEIEGDEYDYQAQDLLYMRRPNGKKFAWKFPPLMDKQALTQAIACLLKIERPQIRVAFGNKWTNSRWISPLLTTENMPLVITQSKASCRGITAFRELFMVEALTGQTVADLKAGLRVQLTNKFRREVFAGATIKLARGNGEELVDDVPVSNCPSKDGLRARFPALTRIAFKREDDGFVGIFKMAETVADARVFVGTICECENLARIRLLYAGRELVDSVLLRRLTLEGEDVLVHISRAAPVTLKEHPGFVPNRATPVRFQVSGEGECRVLTVRAWDTIAQVKAALGATLGVAPDALGMRLETVWLDDSMRFREIELGEEAAIDVEVGDADTSDEN